MTAKPAKSPQRRLEDSAALLAAVRSETARIVIGQERVIDLALTALLSGGHALLVGVPGLAKTLLAETLAHVLGLSMNRVQCTPDLMPADILGSEVLDQDTHGKRAFRFIEGPVFAQLLMADEINRASPRTQSALLQAMQEKEISVGGKPRALPMPFHVLATQNPIEHEGTYPLPEAQLDRFLMQIDVDYPDESAERVMVLATTGNQPQKSKAILNAKTLMDVQALVRDMPMGESVVDAILKLVRGLRPEAAASPIVRDYVTWGPGPRGSQGLMLAVRARALLDGRSAPSVEDVCALALPVLKHRMALNYKARAEGIEAEDVVNSLTSDL